MLSAKGVHVVPEFSVFQTPPDPTATYHTFSFFGSMAISAILPDINAGPMLLNLNALSADLTGFFSFLPSLGPCPIVKL